MNYKINEIFMSLQGEGSRVGTKNIFIRFSKCNLACYFCDTEFESGKIMTKEDILDAIGDFNCKNIIMTGGEPLLQVDKDLFDLLKQKGYFLCIETNGSIKCDFDFDYITCSPKMAEHVVEKKFKNSFVNELRYVISRQSNEPKPKLKADHYYLSPEWNSDAIDKKSFDNAVDLIMKSTDIDWKLSTQHHKFWGLR